MSVFEKKRDIYKATVVPSSLFVYRPLYPAALLTETTTEYMSLSTPHPTADFMFRYLSNNSIYDMNSMCQMSLNRSFHKLKHLILCVLCKGCVLQKVKLKFCVCSDGGSDLDKERSASNVPMSSVILKLCLCKKCLLWTS